MLNKLFFAGVSSVSPSVLLLFCFENEWWIDTNWILTCLKNSIAVPWAPEVFSRRFFLSLCGEKTLWDQGSIADISSETVKRNTVINIDHQHRQLLTFCRAVSGGSTFAGLKTVAFTSDGRGIFRWTACDWRRLSFSSAKSASYKSWYYWVIQELVLQ